MAARKPLVVAPSGRSQLLQAADSLAINPGASSTDAAALSQLSSVIMTSGDVNANEVMFDMDGSIMLHLPI
jgi:hypothetical protein